MAGLDEISRVIGGIEKDVKHILERVEHTHDCLHGNGGIAPRVSDLERSQAYERGWAAGLGFLSGSGALAMWKGISVIAGKLGLGAG